MTAWLTIRIQDLAVCWILGANFILVPVGTQSGGMPETVAIDSLNATYSIEGKELPLMQGRHETMAMPGSATKVKTAVLGKPLFAELDGDGGKDTVLFLTHDPGGSGTFYYIGAAIHRKGGYQGSDSVFLGDRIKPKEMAIRKNLMLFRYVDRLPGESMPVLPTAEQTRVFTIKEDQLIDMTPPGERGNIVEGWLTIGHEVRTFKPCNGDDELWLIGESPAVKEILDAYWRALPDGDFYQPLFAVLAGESTAPPTDGFGSDYDGAFLARHLMTIAPGARCKLKKLNFD